jgi:hypothetical protein
VRFAAPLVYAYPRVPLCTPVYPCLSLCAPVYPCVQYPCVVYHGVSLCTPVYPCVPVRTPVYAYCQTVSRCAPVYPYVSLCTYPCKKRNPPPDPPIPPYLSSGVLPRATPTFDGYPPSIVPRKKERFLRHRSSCLSLRAKRARSGGVRPRSETRGGRGAMRARKEENLNQNPQKTVSCRHNFLPAWRLNAASSELLSELLVPQSFSRLPPSQPHLRLK